MFVEFGLDTIVSSSKFLRIDRITNFRYFVTFSVTKIGVVTLRYLLHVYI